jgi:anthranilate synthase/aminodeoxychorismate synthase-like glutamine amidotransferase
VILLLDNYDSFVWNLARYVAELGFPREVVRSDAITLAGIESLAPTHIVVSPGPGTPDTAGIALEAIRRFGPRVPILGVCLGHQAIGQAYGGRVVRARRPLHGKATLLFHEARGLFSGLPSPLRVGRYHSLVVEPSSLPLVLEVVAWSAEGEIMGLRHRFHPVVGVQFHPESVLTECGHDLLRNFLDGTCWAQRAQARPPPHGPRGRTGVAWGPALPG